MKKKEEKIQLLHNSIKTKLGGCLSVKRKKNKEVMRNVKTVDAFSDTLSGYVSYAKY